MPPALSVEDLHKTYHSGLWNGQPTKALRGVDLSLEPGRIFGLLGPNGAGKTTLVKILLGIVQTSRGHAALFGTPVMQAAARTRVGYLPEKHTFPGLLTATQLLHLYGRLARVSAADRRTRIPALLHRVGLGPHSDRKLRTFSKGMQQRMGLAQALLNHPDLLFLDEPTDGVDPVGRRDIRDVLLYLRDRGTTIFINSHLLSEVEKVCGEVAIMHEGAIVKQGDIASLTAVDHAYRLTCTALPEELPEAAAAKLSLLDEPAPDGLAHFQVAADDRAALNALLDTLRTHGVEVERIVPVRRSLEDYFIEVVSPPAA
ncbi:MAG: ATP-binding cassette domain-containing protein [Bacteroidetes bacterium]|jgi:ABC-2 type transport system ATP-binding protein|nr:ATP-binding cassette domain-containing protein [Bacteroidota bacterium]